MNKHKLMVRLSSGAVMLSLLVHIIHRIGLMNMPGMSMERHPAPNGVSFLFLMLPLSKWRPDLLRCFMPSAT